MNDETGFMPSPGADMPRENLRALIRDASRYRWLREAKFIEIITDTQMFRCGGSDELDRVVDTAATP